MRNVEIAPYGESAIRVVLGDRLDWQLNQQVHSLRANLLSGAHPELMDLIPGYASLLVRFDPLINGIKEVEAIIQEALECVSSGSEVEARKISIPVYYGGQSGPDLGRVAQYAGISAEDVIQLHASGSYRVFIIGFTPGFAYMGGLPDLLVMPRLTSPRTAVPAGSVGIAGQQTGIYPLESPGGWQLIGWTPLVMFDAHRSEPCFLQPGDMVQFIPQNGERP